MLKVVTIAAAMISQFAFAGMPVAKMNVDQAQTLHEARQMVEFEIGTSLTAAQLQGLSQFVAEQGHGDVVQVNGGWAKRKIQCLGQTFKSVVGYGQGICVGIFPMKIYRYVFLGLGILNFSGNWARLEIEYDTAKYGDSTAAFPGDYFVVGTSMGMIVTGFTVKAAVGDHKKLTFYSWDLGIVLDPLNGAKFFIFD